jgi:hypothetical protein
VKHAVGKEVSGEKEIRDPHDEGEGGSSRKKNGLFM